jgi:enamine deaminase RidA (YjgF/YER057c/UK114 family)
LSRRNVGSHDPFEDTYGYSRAVRVGDHVLVSGTTARAEDLGADAYVQAKSALGIIAAAMRELDAGFADVVRTAIFIVDMADMDLVARAHAEAFGAIRPVSTLLQVAALTPAQARVEIEVTAIVSAATDPAMEDDVPTS